MAKVTQCKLSELKTTFFVRTGLDQEHVLKLADLYLAGVKLPPLEITANREIIDGRHRKEAMEIAFDKEYIVDVEVSSSTDPLDVIAEALRSNEGGPLPSTRADIIHTIGLLITRGAKDKSVFERLDFLPRDVVRKYMESAKANIRKRLIQQAKEAVADGATVREAAERFGIDVKDLKQAISGPKVGISSTGTEKLKTTIANRFYGINRSNQALVRRIVTGFSDGDVPEKTVEAVLGQIDKLLSQAQRRSKDWRRRFEAAKDGKFFSWKEIDQSEDSESEAA